MQKPKTIQILIGLFSDCFVHKYSVLKFLCTIHIIVDQNPDELCV